MAISIVQSNIAVQLNTENPTVSFSAASANNIIVAVCCNSDDTAPVVPSGYTAGPAFSNSIFSVTTAWKLATGGETSVTFTGLDTADDSEVAMIEITGNVTTGNPDGSSEDESKVNDSTATSVTTDSTASGVTPTGDGIAIALFGFDRGQRNAIGVSYSGSFTVQSETTDDASGGCAIAANIFTGTTAQICTRSDTDAGDEKYGAMLVFKAAAGGGGGSTIPPLNHHYRTLRAA